MGRAARHVEGRTLASAGLITEATPDTGSHLGHRTRGRLGDAGRGRPVKLYTGRNGRLPKHFVARQKLCLPASVSYWINALGGAPLLCLHKALDPKLAPK